MAITLEAIWESSSGELQVVLQSQGYDLSSNLQHDRALIAMIYYNQGLLNDEERVWVGHPNFLTSMTFESTLTKGLHRLQSPYMTALLHLYMLLNSIEDFQHADSSVLDEVEYRNLRNNDDDDDWGEQFNNDVGKLAGDYLWHKRFDDFRYSPREGIRLPPSRTPDVPRAFPLPVSSIPPTISPTGAPSISDEWKELQIPGSWEDLGIPGGLGNLPPIPPLPPMHLSDECDLTYHASIKLENLLPDGNNSEDPLTVAVERMTLANLPTGVTALDIAQRWAKTIWVSLLNSDAIIRSRLQEVIQKVPTFPKPTLDVKVTLTRFLDDNLDRANPTVRCIFLYSFWEFIKASGAEETLPELVTKFWLQVEAYGCLDAFKSEMDTSELTIHLIPALGSLLQSYLEPPPRAVMVARILAALNI